MFCPLENLSTLPGVPDVWPVTLKNVGLIPLNDKANPANATIASSTLLEGNFLNKNSIDFSF